MMVPQPITMLGDQKEYSCGHSSTSTAPLPFHVNRILDVLPYVPFRLKKVGVNKNKQSQMYALTLKYYISSGSVRLSEVF